MGKSLNEFLGKHTANKAKKNSHKLSDDSVLEKKRRSPESSGSPSFALPSLISSQSVSYTRSREVEAANNKRFKEDSDDTCDLNLKSTTVKNSGGQCKAYQESHDEDKKSALKTLQELRASSEEFNKKYKGKLIELALHYKNSGTGFDILDFIERLNKQKVILLHNLNLIGDN